MNELLPIPRQIDLRMEDGSYQRAVVIAESSKHGLKANWAGITFWVQGDQYRELDDPVECNLPIGIDVDDLRLVRVI